jgi:hypothetical protein
VGKINFDITFHPSYWNKNLGINFNEDFFYNYKYRLEADLKMRKYLFDHFGKYGIGEKDPEIRPIIGSDLIACGFILSEIAGCDVVYSDSNSPQVICKEMNNDEIREFKCPDLNQSHVFNKILNDVKDVYNKFGYSKNCINFMGIQNVALDLRGQEIFIDYLTSPDEVDVFLNEITKLTIDFVKEMNQYSTLGSGGVTSIVNKVMPNVYVTSNCSVDMISNKMYEDILMKYDNILSDNFGEFGIHHCGSKMEDHSKGYAKVKNLKFAEVGALSNIKEVRKDLPGIFLNLRYSPVKIANENFSQTMENILNMLEQAGNTDLISISCVGIDNSVRYENICNFLNACKSI